MDWDGLGDFRRASRVSGVTLSPGSADGQLPRQDSPESDSSAVLPEDQAARVQPTEGHVINNDVAEVKAPAQRDEPEPVERSDCEPEKGERETSNPVPAGDGDVNMTSKADHEAEIKQIKATWKKAGKIPCTIRMDDQS
ncbi:hypothetical protein LTR48_003370, partial [Friedmanniomyces endolithicus]